MASINIWNRACRILEASIYILNGSFLERICECRIRQQLFYWFVSEANCLSRFEGPQLFCFSFNIRKEEEDETAASGRGDRFQ